METISALGKEWEIVADTPSNHRSRSRDHRRGSLDKTDPALSAVALENAWTGPQSRPRMLKGRRSASADSITSSSRKPPTPPPKPQSAQSPRPPTTGPQLPRRSQTPPSRRSSPSPSLSPSKPVISGPVAIQRTPSRRDSSSRADTRSPRQSPTKSDGRLPKSGSPVSPLASSTQRATHKPSASTEDLGSARDANLRAKVAWERERMQKGQSWSVSESSPEEEERQLQLRLAVIRGTQAGHGRPPTSQSAGSGGTDGGTSVTRAGKFHTRINCACYWFEWILWTIFPFESGVCLYYTVPFGGIMHSQSYSHSQSRFGYEAAPLPAPSAPHPHLVHSSSLPAGYPSSSSLPDLSLSTYPPQPNAGSTYVQFSTRAPYPIAPYPYDAPTSPWTQYPSPS
ncbi:hypothetical protein BS47DRAFT_951934 [Hydnum rufescens UP504]|uniref:Uncharacterized protein n=1 Tax=Hydnum rufescens UP504 TaxID=1448309 RepID=A0A9P6AXE6_9AGAM|nr:hypothetical protein BS47DRAFT_951934 [Hydnum rufescens UP504]